MEGLGQPGNSPVGILLISLGPAQLIDFILAMEGEKRIVQR
jgi:hypothetical protein